ncbi:glutamine synthetase [Tanacetum coccineum]|uniref:Glutamine synthetase n=1 Tax=Tanacetum coccineum TaxID=301880 RepID=A0ABQ4ZU84_9ASTR
MPVCGHSLVSELCLLNKGFSGQPDDFYLEGGAKEARGLAFFLSIGQGTDIHDDLTPVNSNVDEQCNAMNSDVDEQCNAMNSNLCYYLVKIMTRCANSMRADGGYEVIKMAIGKLKKNHIEHIAAYGEGSERRSTGKHETADIKNFKGGVANRGASIRVGRETERKKNWLFRGLKAIVKYGSLCRDFHDF